MLDEGSEGPFCQPTRSTNCEHLSIYSDAFLYCRFNSPNTLTKPLGPVSDFSYGLGPLIGFGDIMTI
jgi:hypothetical protein